jgi:lambda family phage portal protein
MSDSVILYGADGRPMKVQAIGWDAAQASGQKDRVRAYNWTSSSDSINNLLATGGVDTIRSRSREAVRNDPVAARAIDTFVSNCVGSGIKPLPTVDDEDLRKEILEAWSEWCYEADADHMSDFYGLQSLAVRAMREGGECFIRFRPRRPQDGLSTPLQVQLLEAEFCDSTKDVTLATGNVVRAGVEFDRVGRRQAYWMFRSHPGEHMALGNYNSFAVPAEQVAHMFQVLRPGQVRGVPSLTPVLVYLHELSQFTDAELVRKKLAAMMCAFQTTPNPDMDILGAGSVGTATDGVELGSLEPGTLQLLPPGHDIRFNEPADVGGAFSDFMAQQMRTIASGLGLTYEQLSGDFSKVNYSSARAAMIEFRRSMKQMQMQVVVHQFCRPIWKRWFETAVMSGRIKLPSGMDTRRASVARWILPGWDQVDPMKSVAAQVAAIQAGLMSRDQAIAESGVDPEELDAEIARGNQRQQEYGLQFDPSVGTGSGEETEGEETYES